MAFPISLTNSADKKELKMSAYCGASYSNSFGFPKMLVLLAVLATGVLLGSHATKHALADTVRNCPDKQVKLILQNPKTGRIAKICQPKEDENQYGRMITEWQDFIEKEVTSFMNSEYRKNTLAKVVQNMCNQGYSKVIFISEDVKDAVLIILSTP
jgi:hypothetical protein